MPAMSYRMDISFAPPCVTPGQPVSVEVRLSDVEGEVSRVHLYVPEGGIFETLEPQGGGVYTLTRPVPYEAPPGTYNVYFYGMDIHGNRGPDVTAQVMVSPW